jgi:hypothetical protein
MPNDIHSGKPKVRFWIFYQDRRSASESLAFENICDASQVDSEISYWLGKSPGMYRDEITRILSAPYEQVTDRTYVLYDKIERENEHEIKRAEEAELAEYERLKSKYENNFERSS